MIGRALIDLDLVVYRVGHACDNWYYEYMGERFDSHKEVKQYIKASTNNKEEQAARLEQAERKRDPESWEETKGSVVSFVEDLIEGYADYKGYISGPANFRYKVATILPYKAGRTADRPHHYDAIRQLLVDTYDAEIASNMEADDLLGLNQNEDSAIISLDKDLDMVPGKHYNWERDLGYEVSEIEGLRSFFKQMLTGDSTDNILGLYGVGPKSALLKNIDQIESEEEMSVYVADQYKARFGSYAGTFLMENAKLLWILQRRPNPYVPGEYWKV